MRKSHSLVYEISHYCRYIVLGLFYKISTKQQYIIYPSSLQLALPWRHVMTQHEINGRPMLLYVVYGPLTMFNITSILCWLIISIEPGFRRKVDFESLTLETTTASVLSLIPQSLSHKFRCEIVKRLHRKRRRNKPSAPSEYILSLNQAENPSPLRMKSCKKKNKQKAIFFTYSLL